MLTVILHHLMSTGVPVWEKIVRAILVYIFLIVSLRLSGKRELAQLNPFDLVVLMTLSNTVQNAIIGDDNSLFGGLVGATALLTANYLVVRYMFFHPRVERVIEGQPVCLIEHGKVREQALRKEFIRLSELRAAAHRQGFDTFADIEFAELEPGGTFSFRRKGTTTDSVQYGEVITRLDKLSEEIHGVRETLKKLSPEV